MTTTPQWKLRRLAARAIKVYRRHAPSSPPIAAYETSVPPAADAYIAAYDAVGTIGAD